jgi:aspartyl aminopeptidase
MRPATTMARTAQQLSADLCAFINAGPSPFHVVQESARRLEAAGFSRLSEASPAWDLRPGAKYYVTRGQSAFLAFALGEAFVPGNGYTITAAHSDSPCLRVKPISALTKGGYQSVGVETYGGGIWHTWMDRDLSVAGRVIVARGGGKYESVLVDVRRPILRVPT